MQTKISRLGLGARLSLRDPRERERQLRQGLEWIARPHRRRLLGAWAGTAQHQSEPDRRNQPHHYFLHGSPFGRFILRKPAQTRRNSYRSLDGRGSGATGTTFGLDLPPMLRRLVSRNMWDSCGRFTLEALFASSPPATLELEAHDTVGLQTGLRL